MNWPLLRAVTVNLVGGLIGGASMTYLLQQAAISDEVAPKIIQAQAFELVDEAGNLQGGLRHTNENGTELILGKNAITLKVNPSGTPQVSLLAPDQKARIEIGTQTLNFFVVPEKNLMPPNPIHLSSLDGSGKLILRGGPAPAFNYLLFTAQDSPLIEMMHSPGFAPSAATSQKKQITLE